MARLVSTTLALTVLAFCFATPLLNGQTAINDVFDRPNSANLGPDWIEADGDAGIVGNKLQANSPFFFGWCAHTSYNESYADTVVQADWSMNGFGGDRVSVIAGADPNTFEGIEIRIADNNGNGLADRIFFNAAVNAGNWFGGPIFFNLANQIAAGRVTLWFTNNGDTANVTILDPVTQTSETFSASGILSFPPMGTSVGIGYFGNGTCDDFQAYTGDPTGTKLTLTAPRVNAPLTLLVTDAAPFGIVVVALSLVGNTPFSTSIGDIHLSAPITVGAMAVPDIHGRIAFPRAGRGSWRVWLHGPTCKRSTSGRNPSRITSRSRSSDEKGDLIGGESASFGVQQIDRTGKTPETGACRLCWLDPLRNWSATAVKSSLATTLILVWSPRPRLAGANRAGCVEKGRSHVGEALSQEEPLRGRPPDRSHSLPTDATRPSCTRTGSRGATGTICGSTTPRKASRRESPRSP